MNNQERQTGELAEEDDCGGSLKMVKTSDFSALPRDSSSLGSNGQQQQQHKQQMLSFSSPKSHAFTLHNDYYHHALSVYVGNTGLNTNMNGGLTEARGPFTPSQWMELEHQALIYKYINANIPIPSNLLNPIRKAFNQSAFSGYFRPNSYGWGSFHLGLSRNNDPEPGRCRRTDGKKWRCSRDSVVDQKYCERHINRGRHRSRKPVESQIGHVAVGPASRKVMPMASSSPASSISSGGASNSLHVAQKHVENLHSGVPDPLSNSHMNRILLNQETLRGSLHDPQGLSMLPPAISMKSKDTPLSNLRQHIPYEDSSATEFGPDSSDTLQNASQRGSYTNYRSYGTSPDLTIQEQVTEDPLRHFMDEWPKNRSNGFSIAWPDVEETQLSISVPMTLDFSSSSSSPTQEKLTLSSLKLPIFWGSSSGGPLGEALNQTNHPKSSSEALNLIPEGWDALSPTGVLQRTSFCSLSNSSNGSSPRTESNSTHEGGSLCDNLLGTQLL